jgi:hypothetical protein
VTKLNPWLIALAALLVFSAGVWLGHTAGAVGRARLAADVAREREQLAKEHAKSIAAARTRERQLSQTLADVSERYEKE